MNGCGKETKKRSPWGQAEGFLRHHRENVASVATTAKTTPRIVRKMRRLVVGLTALTGLL